MSLSGTVRAFANLAFDAAEALWDVCSAFTSPIADDIWAKAVGRGGGNDVGQGAEPSSGAATLPPDPRDQPSINRVCVFCFRPTGSCDCLARFIPASSPAPASVGDDLAAGSIPPQDVESAALQLTPHDLYDAATALRSKARDALDPKVAAEWGRIAARFDTAFCNAVKK